jgi:hypothetical protein
LQGPIAGKSTLLPECLDDWIDESNPVRVIDAFAHHAAERAPRRGVVDGAVARVRIAGPLATSVRRCNTVRISLLQGVSTRAPALPHSTTASTWIVLSAP